MLHTIQVNRACRIAERWVYKLIIGFTIASLAMFTITSAAGLMGVGVSVVPFWYLGIFISIALVPTIILGGVLYCINRESSM